MYVRFFQSTDQKASRTSPQPRRCPQLVVKALNGGLIKRRKQTDETEERFAGKTVEDLHRSRDNSTHCDLEIGCPRQCSSEERKIYAGQLGIYQPVLMFSPAGNYKFHVFIYN